MEEFITQDPSRNYPTIDIKRIENPSRFYAFPIIGGLVKIILLIPVGIEIIFLALGLIFITIINSFIVLITGKYWSFAYAYTQGVLKLLAKANFYFEGLTDKYPGFGFNITDFSMDFPNPQNPNRLFAIPIFGFLIRAILLIPYFIWNQALSSVMYIAMIVSSFPVLIKGKYPESTYEFLRDSFRVSQGSAAYMLGFSDTYPSFYISFNHKNIKITLIIIGFLIASGNFANDVATTTSTIINPTPAQTEQISNFNLNQ